MFIDVSCKKLHEGVLPTLNLPVKSFPSNSLSSISRSSATISKREHFHEEQMELVADTEESKCYSGFKDFITRIQKLKFKNGWHLVVHLDHAEVKLLDKCYIQPKFEIFVNQDLTYTLRCYGWIVSSDSSLIQAFPTFEKITLSAFITALEGYKICQGILLCSLLSFLIHIFLTNTIFEGHHVCLPLKTLLCKG